MGETEVINALREDKKQWMDSQEIADRMGCNRKAANRLLRKLRLRSEVLWKPYNKGLGGIEGYRYKFKCDPVDSEDLDDN
jgi:predicted transcriptional regulator